MILNSLKDKGGCDGHKISYHSLHLKKNEILFQVFILKSCILDIHREEKVKKKMKVDVMNGNTNLFAVKFGVL